MSLRVIVVGAGLGGLALAQGLRREGVDVAVYERDRTPADRLQGYRLHINADGSRALYDCLPAELFEAFLATCGQPNTGIGIYTHRLRQLAWFGGDPGTVLDPVDSFKSVSRVSLRHVLLAGLGEIVHFDQNFTHYEITRNDQVAVHFASGEVALGDVLVGADGGGSRVRRQYLPHADRIDTGMRGIQGKVWLDDDVRERVPERLFEGPIMIPGVGGYGMFLALHQFQPIPPGVQRYVSAEAAQQRGYVMWGLLARQHKFPPDLAVLDSEELRDVAVEATRRWHPTLQHLVGSSDLDTVLLTPIRSAVPVEAWTPSRVTLIGDAIHSMPPTGGIGANTALRDAALLSSQLVAPAEGRIDVVEAISGYEAEMRRYGFDAVASSMRNLRRQQRTENPLVLAGMKAALRTAGALPAIRQRALS